MPFQSFHKSERLIQMGRHREKGVWLWDSWHQTAVSNSIVYRAEGKSLEVVGHTFFDEAAHVKLSEEERTAAASAFNSRPGVSPSECIETPLSLGPACETQAEAIRRVVESRQIARLVHFTHVSNVASILQHGLLSRSELSAKGLGAKCVDRWRRDGTTNASSLSIQSHNYKMLYSICKGEYRGWALLALRPSVLWNLSCRFYAWNAAARSYDGKRTSERSSVRALEELFDARNCEPKRSALISTAMPTNPQAEVMCLEPVSANNIIEVIVSDQGDVQPSWRGREDISIRSDVKEFGRRVDYPQWTDWDKYVS